MKGAISMTFLNAIFVFLVPVSLGAIFVSVAFLIYTFYCKATYNRRRIVMFVALSVGSLVLFMAGFNFTATPEQRADWAQKRAQERVEKEQKEAIKKAQKQKVAAEEKQQQQQRAKAVVIERDANAITQAIPSTIRTMENKKIYPLVNGVRISADHKNKEINMSLVVEPECDKDTALDLADTLIKKFASNVVAYGGLFSSPKNGSYGDIVYTYTIVMGIAYPQSVFDREDWIYDQRITPGKVVR